jgi:hypothetical protein
VAISGRLGLLRASTPPRLDGFLGKLLFASEARVFPLSLFHLSFRPSVRVRRRRILSSVWIVSRRSVQLLAYGLLHHAVGDGHEIVILRLLA